jgi:metalloprotease
VYMAKDVNAFAMANGCIRVYSGLMDMMTDNEVEAVIGHEMGHVALGHVKKGMQVALGTNAVRVAAASAGGIVGSLSQSQLGNLGEKLVNSQFSQRQEAEADDYSYDLLRQRGISPAGLATSFEKLAKLEEGRQSSMLYKKLIIHCFQNTGFPAQLLSLNRTSILFLPPDGTLKIK